MNSYRFGEWHLDPNSALLTRAGEEPIALRRLTLRVLCHLLDHAPNLVSKESLLDAVWGRLEVSESVVAQVIKELRQVLGDSAQSPRYIETRPRQGYRMLQAVERLPAQKSADQLAAPEEADQVPDLDPVTATVPPRRPPNRLAIPGLLIAALVVLMLGVAWWSKQHRQPELDPELRQAAFKLDYRLVPAAPLDWPLPDAIHAAEALLARSDLPRLYGLIAALKKEHEEPLQRGWIDLIELRAKGRDFEALSKTEALLALAPDDAALMLWRAELESVWRPVTAWHPLPDAAWLPAERRLLLEATRAGMAGNPETQAEKAQAAMALSSGTAPALHELARVEWAKALARQGDNATAMQLLAEAEAALRTQGYPRLALGVLFQRAALARRTGQGQVLAAELEAQDAEVAASGDGVMRAELTRQRGILLGIAGQHEVSLGLLESAATMFLELGDQQRASSALNASSGPLARLGRVEEVPARLAEAQRLAAQAGHAETEAAIAGNLSLFHWRRGEIGAAVDGMRRALSHFERADRSDDVAQARNNLATLLREAGELDAAEPLRTLSIDHARRAGLNADLANRLFAQAEDRRARGDLTTAIASLDESERLYRDIGDAISLQAIECLRGLWAFEAGRIDEARDKRPNQSLESHPTADQMACSAPEARLDAIDQGITVALARLAQRRHEQEASGQRLLELGSRLLTAELLLEANRPQEALDLLYDLHDRAAQAGHGALERSVALLRWRVQLQRGDTAEREFAKRQAEDLVRRFPDQAARVQTLCLQARMLQGDIAAAAHADCERQAAASGLGGLATSWLQR